ncbi:MAG: NAD(P)-dependent oxidoreductase [Verrucomicrobiota bacterium]
MKILITGITGYIGSHLAKDCLRKGWTVYGIARPDSKTELLQKNGILSNVKIERTDGGVASLQKIIQKAKPDLVFHMATLYVAEHQPQQVGSLIESNIRFGCELLEAMRAEGVDCLVSAETAWQFDPMGNIRPVNLYAATKEAFAVLNHFYEDAYGFRTIKFKLFDTYGGNDNRPKLLNKLREISKTGQVLELSKGEQILDFTHIDDVTAALCLGAKRVLLLKKGKCEEYVISGYRLSLKNWIQKINQIMGSPLSVRLGAKPYRAREVMIPWPGGKKIKGWKCKVSPLQGLSLFFSLK